MSKPNEQSRGGMTGVVVACSRQPQSSYCGRVARSHLGKPPSDSPVDMCDVTGDVAVKREGSMREV